ncbi:unnamed protein product [Adineta steineri]|uniref:Carrier domain-containing protein n=1 Tax=Adineta steineri TaxID=433720 RepID=A0A813QWX2_9BILA|nr:unnamed protein product [Adineta steineri]CAF1375774.1 unnamed protein product [Adineta steineri]
MFVTIDDQIYMKTGDLARYNERGELVHAGRIDFQVKVHGQRVETAEIENTIITCSSDKIFNCLVTKAPQNDNFLIAYVVSNDLQIDTEEIRQHCSKYLRQYMVPSMFIVLEKLPLNANGKIDRKNLPIPDFSALATIANDRRYIEPMGKVEILVHSLWCEILDHSRISTSANFFSIGGHSILFIRIYQYYRTLFNLDNETINIRSFLDHNTIAEHAKLLENIENNNIQTKQWHTLHINQCIASYVQQRIYLDEKMRFSGEIAIYNELIVLQVTKGSLSTNRLLQALRCVLSKNKILRTSLVFNNVDSTLEQSITDEHLTFKLAPEQTFKTETELHTIISQINTNPNLFDLSSGRVFYCQILRQQMTPDENHDKEVVINSDVLVIGFHHAAIDQSTVSIFLNDLCSTYNSNMTWLDDKESLQYIDYSVHERLIDMTPSCEFWRSQLNGYNQECRLTLPVDRHCLCSDQRSGYASIAYISFDNEISTSFINYASSHQVTPFQLALATFYAFLFKLTYRQNDLCISCLNANRYKTELQNMVGMFISTLPYRLQVDPDWSFDELIEHVREKCVSILEHSHYPLQHILTDSQLKQSQVPFLETALNFITLSEESQWSIDTATLQQLPLQKSYGAAKFDFDLTCLYNPSSDGSKLSFCLTCSRDLFDETTAIIIAQRLKHFVDQLFSSKSISNEINPNFVSISKLSLILPTEAKEIEDTVFCRQQNIVNEAPASYSQAGIWFNEQVRFDPNRPQLAIYNMPFLYRYNKGHTLSIKQLRQALQLVVRKHQSLRTLLIFDAAKDSLMQQIVDFHDDNNRLYAFIETTYETQEQLNHIIHEEKYNPQLFDVAQGLVFRCHLVYYKQISSDKVLSDKDLIIFNFNHALFDFPSMEIFLYDLNQAYTTGQLLYDDNTNLRYLDYAAIEQQMSMIDASMFWLDALHDCKLDQPLALPFDRYRLANEHRTDCGTTISFDFGKDLSHDFLTHASSNNISLEHLTFAIYFIFLFKLTNEQTDLCLAMNINNNRYRDELKSIIGLFENVIPLRCQLDPHWCFHQLFEHVREITTNSMKYSYFPLQRILNLHPHISKHPFLDTSLEFISYKSNNDNNVIMIGDAELVPGSFSFNVNEDEILSTSDFSLSIYHDINMNQLSCTINASLDLFNRDTVEKISQRFHFISNQLFVSTIESHLNKPIFELSLILSNERYLMQSMNNTQVSFPSPVTCIHHEFVYQVMKHPQKVAVELDEQLLTYCELLYYVQILSLALLNEYHVIPGEIVCQCVERSLSMVIGIMAVGMAGGVYCPLSSRDPQHRLHALTQQTQSRLILVHHPTTLKFSSKIVLCNVDLVWNVDHINSPVVMDRLSNITVTADNIAYIVFTSGSTGTSKGVQIRHRNFLACIDSLVRLNLFTNKGTLIQMASCSYDVHVQEIIGPLITSSTIIMLGPQRNMDLDYITKTLNGKQVSYFSCVPSYADILLEFLQSHSFPSLNSLRTVAVGGEASTVQLIDKLYAYLPQDSFVWNGYGPSETTVDSTIYVIGRNINMINIPMGRPLLNYRCIIINQYLQSSVSGQEGELFIGGVGVFAGYLGRDDLTAKALVEIDGEIFYRTGDLVKMDNNGLLHYQGRKDHQVKLHGQRIELGEIERCLLNITSISACVVVKWNDDYLVAYAQSSDIDEEQLRQHCQSYLPLHMIPSIFIILDKLPLNVNGKIDRKLLPSPHFSSTNLINNIELLLPINDIEVSIQHIWCEIFKQNQISTDTNIFTIGGHSLLIMQLFHRYKIEFHLETNTLSISNLFQHPTIIHHAQLIQQSINTIQTLDNSPWSSLRLIQGKQHNLYSILLSTICSSFFLILARASFAQERIYLDEQIRFSSNKTTMNNMYVIPLLYRISSMNDHVSITRLHHAFESVIAKHNILRTALYLDINGVILQDCQPMSISINDTERYRFSVVNMSEEDYGKNETIKKTLNQTDLFDLSKGHVINCHILRQYQSNHPFIHNNDLLTKDDLILFTIHHAMFDGVSTSIFLHDLSLAYQSDDSLSMDENTLNYIDYSVHEHIMDMSLSREFWHSQLEEYNIESSLALPVDRQRSSISHQRSGLASTAGITFDNELCTSFLNYASSHHLTLFQLGLSIFYVFLFKLSHGKTDLCIGSINANRYRSELVNMIGMFVSTLPYHIELNPCWSFDEVVEYVQEKCLSILEHSHYPLQHILGDNRSSQSKVSFLETIFDFISVSKDVEHLCFNDANLEQISLEQSLEMSKFDFSLTFEYNPSSDNKRLSCRFVCSHDLFEKSSISKIAQRFQYMFQQLFQTQSSNTPTIDMSSSISKVCLILPDEAKEMELVVFHRFENIVNEAPASFAQARIWLDEKIRFDPDKPQIAIYNMPFVYRLQPGHTLSIKQLRHALYLTVNKHPSLHASLHFDIQKNLLMQRVITHEDKNNNMFSIIETTYETNEQLNEILHEEKRNPHLFDLDQGLVFRCHIVYYKQISSDHLLSHKDLLIFNFHHALFDFSSMDIFLDDLNQAYTTDQLLYDDTANLRYLDYTVIEQQMSMTGASMFWLDVLHDCKLDQPLSLPYDRYRVSNEHRTGRGTSISFDFGQDLSHDFLHYASSNSISLEQLVLATYYIFLFKLTNGDTDLCIGINTHGRYRDELNYIIGMFVNAIPLRCQLDPHLSFHKVSKHVQDNMINCMKYSYFPLQRILNQHPNISNPVFLDTSFEFLSSMTKDEENEMVIGDSRLSLLPYSIKISEDETKSKFDFIVSFQHDLNLNEISCTINASLDLFNAETIGTIGQRFQTMLHQQFTSFNSTTNKPIHELSIMLSDEQYLMQSLNSTQISFSSPFTCIHHAFVYQVMKHPQKLAVELDEQSLTYSELLYYVQVLCLTLLNEYHVSPGEIVCQCVERSLSMVIGIMAIEMAGGVYCPLSSRDPQHRLHALIQQTQSRLVLVHYLTRTKFDHNIVSPDIDSILNMNNMNTDIDYNYLSSVIMKSEEIAYIIFTSGSTGTPKAVQVRHKNFINCIHSFVYINLLNKDDTVVQIARCSFDIHVQEILGTLSIGGTLIMLHPGGTFDFNYLSEVLENKQITYLKAVPSLLHIFFTFIQQNKNMNAVKYLRSLCSGGEAFSIHLIGLIVKIGVTNCIVWNLYGPAEATIDCTVHCLNFINDIPNIPIGRPFYNYRCIIINQYFQSSATVQEGELFIGGVGVFAGYLGRDDLTAKALVEIDGEIFYRTGDLVKMDNNGLLYYQGRKDHQIKLHGQRIELGEIERCLLNTTSISNCVVVKWNDDHLVAYVQSSDINEQELREHCQSHLPPHMIPSVFIILDKLPLNQNGKVDRKQLPSPDFSLSTLLSSNKCDTPLNQFEEQIHIIWCQVLHSNQNNISRTTSFFSVGGHSLLFIELYHHYQSVFSFDAHSLSIAPFLQQPTIFQHSQLLQTVTMSNIKVTQWHTLHINEGIASFAQERIFLDEQVRFSSDTAIYNELIILQIVQGSLSFNRLLQAFRYVLNKHKILRTSLMLNNDTGILKQCITDIYKTFTISMNQTFQNENELRDIMYQTTINPHLFDLSTGRVFHAEILKHQISSNENENNNNEFITKSDVLLIAFHHAAFDRASRSIFSNDLCLTYNTNATSIEDDESLQYIDYSVHEHLIDMTTSHEFWYLQLAGYNLEYRLPLPVDRHRLSSDHRSSTPCITGISFDNEISQSFLDYVSIHHVTPFQLGLTILYAFLFKLTHGDNDLCISCLNANRHKTELQNIIGMFVSTLPYRLQLDPQWSFDDLVKYVQEKCISLLEHSHYPLQHILANLHTNQSNISFLETMFDFITISSQSDELSWDGASFKYVSLEQSFGVAMFDFMLMFVYNPMLENNRLSFRLTCSHDLFDEITVTNIGRRLEYCFQQLFSSNETMNRIDTGLTSVSKFNLILPEETQEMEDAIFCRQSHIINEAPASFAQIRLWDNESIHFTPHISQIPINNMSFVYHLHNHHTLSIQHLRHALQLTVLKHQSLHTSLLFDTEKNLVMQRIIDMNDDSRQLLTLIESTYETQEQLNDILHDEKYNLHLFDLTQGLVFRCHIVYYKQISSNYLVSNKDTLIFNFHHSLFDLSSMQVFLHDLNQAYTTGELLYDVNTTLRYLDYAAIEQEMSMTGSSMFWLNALHNCHLDQSLSLPYDRYRLMNEHRTHHTTSVSFDFGLDLSHHFLLYTLSNNIKHEHLALATYFIFLFKLTNGEKDLCTSMSIDNRYRDELKYMIGLFENIIPLRCQLNPAWSLSQFIENVREITTNSMKYSYFPLQRILSQHSNVSKPAFLDISFQFLSSMTNSDNKLIMIGDSQLCSIPFIINIDDFSLLIQHDRNINQLSCTINASLDLFNVETIDKISQRFHSILNQLFTAVDNQMNKSVYEISLTLPNERLLMQSMNNTQVSFSSSVTCIHHEFVYQVVRHPQKLAVELDEQSLTYAELLYYVQVLSLTLLNEYHVFPGEVVIGIMAIEMSGSVYCPLSPRDPEHRLQALVQQTQSRLVLVHHLTKSKVNNKIVSVDIHSTWINNDIISDVTIDLLSSITVTSSNIAYIVFTSGSTGIPKSIRVRHRNFIHFTHSFMHIGALHKNDIVMQLATSSFDAHVQEILATLVSGATVIMLHPDVRSCRVWNLYGPAEATLGTTYHLVNEMSNMNTVPIGTSFPNYKCLIINDFLQSVTDTQEGELFVGGVGVFAGYLGRDDLTAKALVEVHGELFYQTGDLVHMDENGLLHYRGRKDHQVKLHGQRIELGEIEQCLLRTLISACVVIKWNDDHLVAYVQSSDIDEKVLREHCQSHLPLHMIPSFFIILEKLPLNANGKIDRKLLPPPNFSSINLTNSNEILSPMNENEIIIHQIWCDLLQQKQISTSTNIFTLGGHSLLIMQLFHRYKKQFDFEPNTLSITELFQHPTITDHAQLISQTMSLTKNVNEYYWSSLHIMKARASFPQERIFLDEQIRFSSTHNNTNNMYLIPLIYRISSMNDHISISRLQHTFQSIISKHQILRTALYLDINGTITQHCLDTNNIIHDKKSSRFFMLNLPGEEHDQNETVKKILNQSDLFDLSIGHVINCHVLRRDQSNHSFTQNNDDLLTKDDLILFTIHHAYFDGSSRSIFIRDLSLAYQSNGLLPIDDNSLQYIDYSIYEHIMDMSSSQEFWQLELKGYNVGRQLSLPVDRQRSSTSQQRSGLASSAEISFVDEICRSFLHYASSHHLTLFQLGLSIFYIFLFKLTHGQTDLCISSVNANRYRSELVNMIGMFVSTLPHRVELDLHCSFDEVVKYVQEKCLSILEHSHYPLQHILADLRLTQSNVSFLETMFDFITVSKDVNYLSLNGVNLEEVSLNESYEIAKFDFSLIFLYNSSSDDNHLSCSFICSRDIFDETTVTVISRRFQHILTQLFSPKSGTECIDLYRASISKFDLILPEEVEEREAIMFHRLENIINEAPASFAQCQIWSENQRDADTDQSCLTAYNIPFFYHLYTGDILSVQQLRHGLQLVVNKHESLHTSLIYDANKNLLMQRVLSKQDINNDMFTITESTYETDEQLKTIFENEKCNPQHFDLIKGLVLRCHIIYYKQISSNNILSDKDIIIFNFHHAFFDYPSMNIFLDDLDEAYKTDQLTIDNATTLRYIDCRHIQFLVLFKLLFLSSCLDAVIEQHMSMTGASMFWLDALHDCHLDQFLSLPYDRHRLMNDHRTNRATFVSFDFDRDLSHHFLLYASSNNIKYEHLALATYFIFLFKLTNAEKDLCISMNINNRYRDELKYMIGLFENVIPLRCLLNPTWSLCQFVENVREMTSNSMKYSYFPLQRILNQHPNISKPAFLDISFQFLSSMITMDNKLIMIGDSQLSSIPFTMNINDFSLLIQHDHNINQLSCTINASLDLFNVETVDKISQRFHSILNQLFISVDDQMEKPIYEISLTLPNERLLMQSMNNTQVSFSSSVTCIHHEFVYQVMKHPQKLAVELDEQSLTYCELLYYVQVLSLNLMNTYHIVPGEIICQCVERSLSMVIGIMAIEMSGGVYCPLSSRDPQHRLHALIQQTECLLVLIHWLTRAKFHNNDIVLVDMHSILTNNDLESDINVNRLADIRVTPNNIAYIIFTSGSTGIPKAVC